MTNWTCGKCIISRYKTSIDNHLSRFIICYIVHANFTVKISYLVGQIIEDTGCTNNRFQGDETDIACVLELEYIF